MRRAVHLFCLVSLAWCAFIARPRRAGADPKADATKDFVSANEAIKRGAYTEAIDTLELLADRGFVHPDASFNRAVAYVERARSTAAVPGDLGRAAAALSETLEFRPNDAAAEAGLARIREEISRRHAREGVAPVMARPSLARAVTSVLHEDVWAGIALFRFVKQTSAQLVGSIGIGFGALLLVGGACLTAGARHFRLTSRPAVIVVEEARLLDQTGKPLPQKAGAADSLTIPEGASVYVLERRPLLDRIEWGSSEGWVTPNQVEILATAQ